MVVFPSIPICVCQIYILKNEPQSQVPKMNLNHSRSQGVQFPLCVEYIVLAAGQIPKLDSKCCMQSYPLHSPPKQNGKVDVNPISKKSTHPFLIGLPSAFTKTGKLNVTPKLESQFMAQQNPTPGIWAHPGSWCDTVGVCTVYTVHNNIWN